MDPLVDPSDAVRAVYCCGNMENLSVNAALIFAEIDYTSFPVLTTFILPLSYQTAIVAAASTIIMA